MIHTEMTITAMKIAYDAHLGQLDCNNVRCIEEQKSNEITVKNGIDIGNVQGCLFQDGR